MLDAQDLQRWRACARLLWLHAAQAGAPEPAEPAASESVPAAVWRASFPGATRLTAARPDSEPAWAQALARTAEWMAGAGPGATLLGACVAADDGSRAWVEVLRRGASGWQLFKPRLATAGHEADVDEVAWWAQVAARAGWRVASVGLLLVNTDFVYPGHGLYAGLFREVDLGPMLGSRPVADWLVAMRRVLLAAQPPAVPLLGAPCAVPGGGAPDCRFLAGCHGAREPDAAAPPDPRLALEVLGRDLAESLRLEGCRSLVDVPEGRLTDARHRRAWTAVRQGAPVLEPAVAGLTRALPGPRRLLRLETMGAAVPWRAGMRPYEVLPFQWTCATEQAGGGGWLVQSFLAEASAEGTGASAAASDPRRDFAESLLAALAGGGAVLAYNAGFERNRLRELARRFADLAPALDELVERIVDLFQLARHHYYHPAMAGSWSARSLFGAVAPQAGAHQPLLPGVPAAQDAFGELLLMMPSSASSLSGPRRQALRYALQAHGERQMQALQTLLNLFDQADTGAPPPWPSQPQGDDTP